MSLQKAAYFMNLYAEQEYFKFKRHKYGPYSYPIDIVSRNIGEFQNYYGLHGKKATYQAIEQQICSDKTTRVLHKLQPAVKKAVEAVNRIDDLHSLEGISTVLFLIQEMKMASIQNIIAAFKAWSEDKASRFSEEEICTCIKTAEQMGFIARNIVGEYELIL